MSVNLPKIACVHQGYELYGSDRSFLESVRAFRGAWPRAEIEVVLPRGGALAEALDGVASRVVFEPLWVLRRRELPKLATIGLARLPFAVRRAARRLAAFDLVYVNTAVLADYALAMRARPERALWHLHEIPEGASLKLFRRLVAGAGAEIVFNSRATQAAFPLPPGRRAHVVYNGVRGPGIVDPIGYDGVRPMRVAMIGRVNRIKGQEVLLAALARLPAKTQARIRVRIVGGAFEDPRAEETLAKNVADSGLQDIVAIEPFAADPAPVFRWADLVVTPSRRPESLGRVPIEAMSHARPVIASHIGGLVEVVEDGVTGWLSSPGDAAALGDLLAASLDRPDALRAAGLAGRRRYEALFAEEVAARDLVTIAERKLASAAARPAPIALEAVA